MVSDTEYYPCQVQQGIVLILVLMEYGLWHGRRFSEKKFRRCLNPCSNGIWSLTNYNSYRRLTHHRLNPCSNGIWSLTWSARPPSRNDVVLILVLMEYGLWRSIGCRESWARGLNPCSNGIWSLTSGVRRQASGVRVLILVLMEYGLWRYHHHPSRRLNMRLNPCSNGIWSLTEWTTLVPVFSRVLILVLMEYGLWHYAIANKVIAKCLNPCSNGIWSLTKVVRSVKEKKGAVLILVLMEYGLWPIPPCATRVDQLMS